MEKGYVVDVVEEIEDDVLDEEAISMEKKEEILSNYKELTIPAIVLIAVFGTILGGANAYLGLYAGTTISVSIPSSIMALTLLQPFKTNVLNINIAQTGISAGSSLVSGLIYTLPALILLGFWERLQWLETCVIALVGGFIGILFSIPLRRSLIIENPLTFPEGIAIAEVLETSSNFKKNKISFFLIVLGIIVGAVIKTGETVFLLWAPLARYAFFIGTASILWATNFSPALLAVGFIVKFKVGFILILGTSICWYFFVPILMWADYEDILDKISDGSAVDQSLDIYSEYTRYIGVGAMLIGGLGTILSLSKSLYFGVKSSLIAFSKIRKQGFSSIERRERDLPLPIILVVILATSIPLFLAYYFLIKLWGISFFAMIFALTCGFLFSSICAYLAGIVGSSNNPISGVTLATVVTAGVILLLFLGRENEIGPPTAVLIGSIICTASALAGDNIQDLKAGNIVGSTPYKQQIAQVIGIFAPSLLLPIIINFVIEAYGIGDPTSSKPNPLIAPQANLIADVSKAIFFGGAPILMIVMGGVLALVIMIIDLILSYRKLNFRLPVLAIALGLYIPIDVTFCLFTGSCLSYIVYFILKKHQYNEKKIGDFMRLGVLFSAGLISGEGNHIFFFLIKGYISLN
eukprot:TRINITY_DN2377_c0_g1_i3.p1 TRINITY_DN2377_c0_g1~~TRINITY_DN2377_c0_g1_i3.p1  ORF type:complete len:636 (+),score=154.83 TRINITY_DN2377_c0_g1_i3:44-1951(+)